jgi:hypothetical protein
MTPANVLPHQPLHRCNGEIKSLALELYDVLISSEQFPF